MTENNKLLLTDEEQSLISQEYPGYWSMEYARAIAQDDLDLIRQALKGGGK